MTEKSKLDKHIEALEKSGKPYDIVMDDATTPHVGVNVFEALASRGIDVSKALPKNTKPAD